MEAVIFINSSGASTRREILKIMHKQTDYDLNCSAMLAQKLEISKVSMKRHIDIMIDSGYIEKINPEGKPIYLQLTEDGKVLAKKYVFY